MKNKAVDVQNYHFQPQDKLFFDTNIWLIVFGPQEPRNIKKIRIYSSAFQRILKAKSKIYIDVLVVSEFINTYARQKWYLKKLDQNLAEKYKESFKKFRNSSHFIPIAQQIATDTRRILQFCQKIEDGFGKLNTNRLINEYASGNHDFNDQVLGELCRSKGLKLITDDGDFKGEEVPILTANRKLLI